MLIVSKFHDYYDTAIAYGVDKECVYARTIETLKSKSRWSGNETSEYSTKDYKLCITPYSIGFCGAIYKCIKIQEVNNINRAEEILVFYDAQSFIEHMKKYNIDLPKRRYWGWSGSRSLYTYAWHDEIAAKEYFNKEISKDLYNIFTDRRVPIFAHTRYTITINPCLKDFKFGKVKDAPTAFQEIHMYLSGVLGNKEKETLDITDKTRAQQHGFDKWSFRTMPADSKKAKRKKRNDK